jgi:hypothetical protein
MQHMLKTLLANDYRSSIIGFQSLCSERINTAAIAIKPNKLSYFACAAQPWSLQLQQPIWQASLQKSTTK